ncbi:MAG: TIGR02147 family protein [Pseudobdellovibrio sp.]
MILYQFTSYSKYLAAELNRRKSLNTLYSLRSMSQQLGISATTLSDVIKGHKKLSEKTALGVSKKLKFGLKETRYFQTLVHYENSQDDNLKKILESQLKVLNPQLRKESEVPDEQYIVLSEWHHVAILELTYLFPKKLNAKIISEQLNIELNQAESALILLEKMSLLEKINDSYIKTKKQFTFSNTFANHALRYYHTTMLQKAQAAIVEQTNKEKFVGSETFPLALDDLKEANEIIENCFQQLLQLSERSIQKTHVYYAGIQMFQLNRPIKKESSNE